MSVKPLKRCSHCREERTTTAFGRARSTRDGLQRTCKICQKAWRDLHKDAIRARGKARYEKEAVRRGSRRQHKKSRTPEHRTWSRMLERVDNPRSPSFATYGGRGIRVCERWRDFLNFYADMGSRPSADYSLDRKDVNGDYTPENCRWATRKEQQRNRRVNRLITLDGLTLTLAEWAERTGILAITLAARLRTGWSVEKALTAPVRRRS